MPWSVRAVPLPDGDRPADLWIDADGCLAPSRCPAPNRYRAGTSRLVWWTRTLTPPWDQDRPRATALGRSASWPRGPPPGSA